MSAVLVIDDNVELRDVLALALRQHGHVVQTAGDGCEGLKLLERQSFDILVTDLVMPDKDGLEVLQFARKRHPHMRIVVMSGDSPRHAALYLNIATKLGAHQTLQKPFRISALLAAIGDSPADEGDDGAAGS